VQLEPLRKWAPKRTFKTQRPPVDERNRIEIFVTAVMRLCHIR